MTGALSSAHLPAVGPGRRAGRRLEGCVTEEPVTSCAVSLLCRWPGPWPTSPKPRHPRGADHSPGGEERPWILWPAPHRATLPQGVIRLWCSEAWHHPSRLQPPPEAAWRAQRFVPCPLASGARHNSAQHPVSPAAWSSPDCSDQGHRHPSMPSLFCLHQLLALWSDCQR